MRAVKGITRIEKPEHFLYLEPLHFDVERLAYFILLGCFL